MLADHLQREILSDVDAFVADTGLVELFQRHFDQFDPRQSANHWVSIYPPLRPVPSLSNGRAMLDAWSSRERDAVAFLYFHLPFCTKKCEFCFFSISTDMSLRREYADLLLREARSYLSHLSPSTRIRHLYFGGGTPSAMPPEVMVRLIDLVRERVSPDNVGKSTLEIHPKSRLPGFEELARAGLITRISIGVQTFDRGATEDNGRIWADPGTVERICTDFRLAGVGEINLDFMTGLEGQDLAHVLCDIGHIDRLARAGLVDSITVYPRSFTASSSFDVGATSAATLVEAARMQIAYRVYMAALGWREDPMYFFARQGDGPLRQPSSCVKQPETVAKLGFGNSAYSYFDRTNFRNVFAFDGYRATMRSQEAATESWHTLSDAEAKRRHLVFGVKRGILDMDFPVPLAAPETEAVAQVTGRLVDEGLCARSTGRIELTGLGKLLLNRVGREYEEIFLQ